LERKAVLILIQLSVVCGLILPIPRIWQELHLYHSQANAFLLLAFGAKDQHFHLLNQFLIGIRHQIQINLQLDLTLTTRLEWLQEEAEQAQYR
jgi:hypothetical protein